MGTRIRIDALPGVYQVRAYSQPVDRDAPLKEILDPYLMTAQLVIVVPFAHVTMLKSDKEIQNRFPNGLWREFRSELKRRGVRYLRYERHDEHGEREVTMDLCRTKTV